MKTKHQLLLIDDDQDDRYLLRSVINEIDENIDILEFDRADVAATELNAKFSERKPLPSLVLLDLNMPVFDGFYFLDTIKNLPVPVIVYTTSAAEADIERSYSLGAKAYMVKPLSYPELKSMFEATFNYWLDVVKPIPLIPFTTKDIR